MRKFCKFLYQTFVLQAKNRRDLIDYFRAILLILVLLFIAWQIAYHVFLLR